MTRQARPVHLLSIPLWTIAALLALVRLTMHDVFADSVKITLPASVSFAVTNVAQSTTGTPNPTSVSFTNYVTLPVNVLRISVKADSNFVPPSGNAIAASNVSWTTQNASNGNGAGGTLSTSSYTQLFESSLLKTSGSVDVVWTLAAPGASIRAGNHLLSVRWKLESILLGVP